MNTTLLFVELLIIGLQVLTWMSLLVVSVFGYNWFVYLLSTDISKWQFIIVLLAVDFVYTLGTIFDRFADILFSSWDKKIKEKFFPSAAIPVSVIRFELGKENEYLNRQFEYARSRMRISRSSAINFCLICVTLLFAIMRFNISQEKWVLFIFVLVIGILLVIGSIYAWYRLTYAFLRLVQTNYDFYVLKYGNFTNSIPKSDTKKELKKKKSKV